MKRKGSAGKPPEPALHAAKISGEKHYESKKPCPRGHIGLRQTSNSACKECINFHARNHHHRQMHKKYTPTRSMPEYCECCGKPPCGRGKMLHLDHNHKTDKFRGWLCTLCNTGIGALGDDFDSIMKAIVYLARNQDR